VQDPKLPEAVEDARKVVEAAVTEEKMVEEFGEQHHHRDETGWRVDLKDEKGNVDMRKVRRFNEMDAARRKAEREAAQRAISRTPQVTIKGPGGKPMKVDERHAERIERSIYERERGRR
jgi:hypothetical protein